MLSWVKKAIRHSILYGRPLILPQFCIQLIYVEATFENMSFTVWAVWAAWTEMDISFNFTKASYF